MKTAYFSLSSGLAMLLSFLFYSDVLRAPNEYCLSGHDGLKNYYTLIYHVRHDTSISRFAGMNYPFGEHVVFTDCQPALAGALAALHRAGWDLTGYGVGITNVLPWLGLGLCAGVLWLLMTCMGAGPVFSVFAAVAVALMNPTMARWSGHFALAYAFVPPAVWYLALKWYDGGRVRYSFALTLFVTLFAFVHLYWAALAAAFLTAFWIVGVFRRPGFVFRWPHFLMQTLAPFIAVKVWLWLSDTITDRPLNPYGFLAYRAVWESVFLPLNMPLGDAINSVVKIRRVSMEGIAYVGLGATVLCLALVFRGFYRAFARRKTLRPLGLSGPLSHGLSASFWVLLFSMGVPFIFLPESVLEWTGPLRQFRSIGRFAWWFYFAINVALCVLAYKKWVLYGGRRMAPAAVFFAVWAYEIAAFHQGLRLFKDKFPNPFLKTWPVNARDFQAIIPNPYFHIGSEAMNVGEQNLERVATDAFSLSATTGLPLAAVMMSRTSFSQTLESLGWGTEPLAAPAVLNRIRDERPFLLLLRHGADGRQIAGKPEAFARKLPGNGLYALPKSYFLESARERAAAVAEVLQIHGVDACVFNGNGFSHGTDTVTLPEKQEVQAWGAKLPSGKTQVLSFWLDIGQYPSFTDIKVRCYSQLNPTSELKARNDTLITAMLGKGKFLVELAVQPSEGDDSMAVVLKAARERKAWDFMLRDGDVFQKTNGDFRFNNRPLGGTEYPRF